MMGKSTLFVNRWAFLSKIVVEREVGKENHLRTQVLSQTGPFQERIHVNVEDLEIDFLKIIHGLYPIESLWVHPKV